MYNPINDIKKLILHASESDINAADISISFPPKELAGVFDISTNLPMILGKKNSQDPMKIAQEIINKLDVESAQVAKPGFINIKMKDQFWNDALIEVITDKEYGFNREIGDKQKINVEFVSSNPTGPMHIGHTRGAIYGDILCNMLDRSGFDVTREFYINDAGSQIEVLAKSFLFRYEQVAKNDFTAKIPEGCYPGEYLIDIAKKAFIEMGGEVPKNPKEKIIEYMLNIIKEDLQKLKVKHDMFTSEKKVAQNGMLDKAFEILKEKSLIYKGILDKPKGKLLEDWEEREQELFKSSAFGDDVDRPLKKSDGSYTYFAGDVGYHYDKIQRGFNKMILILGSDHKGYKKRISSAVKALSDGRAEIDVKICEIVNFLKNGEPVKMSKRAGNFLLASDVVEEVDIDIMRFMMLTRRNDTILNFDFEKVKEQSKDNPVFYVQYANARCNSLINKAKLLFGEDILQTEKYSIPDNILVRNLITTISYYPETVGIAVAKHEPHLLIFYAIELASHFHSIWNSGFRFVVENDKDLTKNNLCVIKSVSQVISSILACCNIKPVESM